MHPRVKKIIIGVLDVLLGVYLVLAVTSFNKPKTVDRVCSRVEITIADSTDAGFLSAAEIKQLLQSKNLYPLGKKMSTINPRSLEEAMVPENGNGGIPFVKTAQCYKTTDGHVCIIITQRTPLIRVKSSNGDDYYLDDHGGTMPNSKYTSDLIVVTGAVSKSYARYYITPMARAIMSNDFWKNQIEQINVTGDLGIELVPRVGDHILYIGHLPWGKYKSQIDKNVSDYVSSKLDRTLKFYKYGLNKVGWNKYSYIDVELDNQIVCRKREHAEAQPPVPETSEQNEAPAEKPSSDEAQEAKKNGSDEVKADEGSGKKEKSDVADDRKKSDKPKKSKSGEAKKRD